MRYIDADKLKVFISTHDYRLSDKWNSTDKGMFTCGIMQVIDEQPIADVRENKRGEWIYGEDGIYCSGCKTLVAETNLEYFCKHNFCPNCGADMRKYLKYADSDTARGGLMSAT